MTNKGNNREQTAVLGRRLTNEEIEEIRLEDAKRGPDRDGNTLTTVQLHRRRLLREVDALNEEVRQLRARLAEAGLEENA